MAPGVLQIVIIILLVMVLFGTGRIPAIMENLAKGINSFKKGLREGDEELSCPSPAQEKVSHQAEVEAEKAPAPENNTDAKAE